MRKIQNFFSYFRASELSTNQIFELFDSSNKGKDISPYKIVFYCYKDTVANPIRLDTKVYFYKKV